ncbi:MAG: hypothetical protein VKP63_02995 [Cyanobacteriota bacterium]|nr:hypothetical protein [Cyanobacteriota bacterium]
MPGSYREATLYPFQSFSSPGLNFDGNGRGNSYARGSFEVFELVVGPSGTILSFAGDFIQFDEGLDDWWNRGSLRLNSSRPLSFLPDPVVEPPPTAPSPGDPLPTTPPPDGEGPWLGGPGRMFPPSSDPGVDEPPLLGSPGGPSSPAPGPLPVAAVLAGWRVSRRLRRRCRDRV